MIKKKDKKPPKKRQLTTRMYRREKNNKMNAHQGIFCNRLRLLIEQCQVYKLDNEDMMHLLKGVYSVIVTELNYVLPKMHQKQLQSEEVLIKLADLAYSDLILAYVKYCGVYQPGDNVYLPERELYDFVLSHYRAVAIEYLQDRYAALLPVRRYQTKKADITQLKLSVYDEHKNK